MNVVNNVTGIQEGVKTLAVLTAGQYRRKCYYLNLRFEGTVIDFTLVYDTLVTFRSHYTLVTNARL